MSRLRYFIQHFLCVGCLLAGILPAAYSQPAGITGTVIDSGDRKPVGGVIVMLKNAEGKIIRNTTTSMQGRFSLAVPEPVAGHTLHFSLLGYAPQDMSLAGKKGSLEVLLVPTATAIREIEVKAPPLLEKGDTLVFNVDRFSDIQDKTIGDVLRKLPGIEVAESGQIKFQGEPINKFYIEGTDMLEGKYGLATNNISHKDVKSVEVLQNHQPIKALEDIAHSDNAAINLRLKEEAKSRWVGTIGIGTGASPWLWDGALFAMRIGAGWQSMQNFKVNNTGKNPAAENRNFSIEDIINRSDNQRSLQDYVQVDNSSAPLDKKRTRFNRTGLFNTTNVKKLNDDYQLNLQLTYAGDRLTGNRFSETTHYIEGGERVVTEEQHTLSKQHDLSGRFSLQGNTSRFFLKNNLTTGWQWNDKESVLGGTYPNNQQASLPSGNFANDFQLVRRTGRQIFTITSYNQYLTKPHRLTVEREGQRQRQDVRAEAFYSNSNVSYGWGKKRWQFGVRGGFSVNSRSLTSELEGLGEIGFDYPLENHSVLNTFRGYVLPSATYETSRTRFDFSVPLDYYHHAFRDKYAGKSRTNNDWLANPQLSVRYSLSAKWTLSGGVRAGKRAVNDALFYNGLILKNYRTLSAGLIDFSNSHGESVSARFEYKNPIRSFFFNGSVVRAWNTISLLSQQWFTGNYILQSYESRSSNSRLWSFKGSVSKGIDGVKGLVSLEVDYNRTAGETGQNGILEPYTSTGFSIIPRFKGRLASWCNAEYKFTYRWSGMELTDRNEKRNTTGFDQNLSLHIIPVKSFYFTLSGEHYRNELTDGGHKSLFLTDLHATWRLQEKWEVNFALTNLFDQREYAYVVNSPLSTTAYAYCIRPRQFLVSTYFRF